MVEGRPGTATYTAGKTIESKVLLLATKTRIRLGLEWEQTLDSLALGRYTVSVLNAILGSHLSVGHFK